MYQLTNASFEIDGKTILSPINLSFEPKKVTTLLGHNGCGKSTLIKLLSRQNTPSKGHIFSMKSPFRPIATWSLLTKLPTYHSTLQLLMV